MNASIAAPLISSGSMPLPVACRASRDKPICSRLAESFANSFFHRRLRGVLVERRTGLNPLASTAAMKLVLILLKVFGLRPKAAGVMAASLMLVAGRSSGRRAGSSPKSSATLLTEERRARSCVSEGAVCVLRAWSTSARVVWAGVAGPGGRVWLTDLLGMAFFLVSGWLEQDSGGQGLTRVAIREF